MRTREGLVLRSRRKSEEIAREGQALPLQPDTAWVGEAADRRLLFMLER